MKHLGVSTVLVAGCGLVLAAACGQSKETPPEPEKKVERAAAEPAAPASEEPKPAPVAEIPPELRAKCAVFEPPWGEGSWIEWGQNNPEAGELWYTSIKDTMQQADLSVLPRCTHLENLFVGFSDLVDLKPLAGLSKLRRLDLRFIDKLADLSPLAGLSNLEYLNVTGTAVTDLSPLVKLPRLAEFEARMLPLTDAGHL
ncbi:MAG TPA: hypothetical protein VM285_04000, partial [Polyangia bacterium]|nr:hypothetical protein [Polyangia bacterium]